MASTSRPQLADAIHGTSPQFLVEKVIRARIYDSLYWKEHCFSLNAESLIDQALACNAIGGVHDRQTPTVFISLLLKLLQIQPEKEILFEYLLAEEFKYLRALAAFYIRLTFRSIEVYEILEPLMKDYRKLRIRHVGGYSLTHFDEFIDELLTQDRVCDIILPRLTQRSVLEETEGLAQRKSLLDEDAEMDRHRSAGEESDGDQSMDKGRRYTPSSRGSSPDLRGRPRSRSRSSSIGSRYVSRSPSRSRSRSGSVGGEEGDTRGRYISRSPSISPDRALAPNGEDGDEKLDGDV